MDRGAWKATVHKVTKSWTPLSLGGGHVNPLPAILPGEFPWTEETGRLKSMGLRRVGHA